jgi:hypothetical protein
MTGFESDWRAEITVFEKGDGILSKRITLDADGNICSDGSACLMTSGSAWRVAITNITEYADIVNACAPNQAISLGRLKADRPSRVAVVVAKKLNGGGDLGTIARTKEYLGFEPGTGGLVLLDFDPKGISATVRQRLDNCGGLFGALCEVVPQLETVAMVERLSTSSGLRHGKTGEAYGNSGGRHIVIPVVDSADIPRFLSDLQDRCWLAGFGWGLVSAAGSFLVRSIVDKSCGSPERLVFEGAPIIVPPLVQDARTAVAHDGQVLDTRYCPPLTETERAKLASLREAEELRLLPERQTARSKWSLEHIKRLVGAGMPEREARATVERWIDDCELTGAFVLPFDNRNLTGTTVEAVLSNPARYVGETLSDPHEGPAYGRGKAIVYQRDDGSLFINSFAHGGLHYELRPTAKPPLPFVLFDQIAIVPKEWLAEKFLGGAEISCWYGEPGCGKSVGVEDFGLHVAAGMPWLGRRVKQGAVLYIALERAALVERRAIAFKIKHDAHGLPFAITKGVHDFRDKKTADIVLQMVAELERVTGQKLVLIIIDTISRALCGGDENSPKDMGALVTTFGRIQDVATEAHLALTHHVPHGADRMRGHGLLYGAIDTSIHVVKGEGVRSATVIKANDADEGEHVAFTLESVTVCAVEGTITTAPVVVAAEGDVEQAQRGKRLGPGATLALQLLEKAIAETDKVPPERKLPRTTHIPRDARTTTVSVWRSYCYAATVSESDKPDSKQKAFVRACKVLQAAGLIGIWDDHVWVTGQAGHAQT